VKGIILDFSSTTRLILAEELKSPGWDWILESNPHSVLKLIDSEDIEIVCTSQELPSISGHKLIESIRGRNFAKPLIALISSYIDKKFIEYSYNIGADLVISKSFASGDLSACFRRILSPGEYLDTILVIDDSPIIRKILSKSLENSGFKVLEAETVQNGKEILKVHFDTIAFVLSDENMEDGIGSDFCYSLRREPRFASLPFFISSAEDKKFLEERSKSCWLNGYFVKPLLPAVVIHTARLFQKRWYSHRMNFKTVLPA